MVGLMLPLRFGPNRVGTSGKRELRITAEWNSHGESGSTQKKGRIPRSSPLAQHFGNSAPRHPSSPHPPIRRQMIDSGRLYRTAPVSMRCSL